MKLAKSRIVFDNYAYISDEEIREILTNDFGYEENEITDDMIMDERYDHEQKNWDSASEELNDFFEGKTVGFFGEVGRWDGVYKAGKIGEFWDLFRKATKDCGYWKIYDENGHLFLTCSHHDGTCHFEIKLITNEGNEYLERWEYGTDNRTEQYVHNQIFNRYSHIPKYAETVYGCPAREYEPSTKGKLIDIINNQAKSFYS